VSAEADRHAIATEQPVVSNLFVGPVGQMQVFALVVPVFRGAEPAYLLGFRFPPKLVLDVLRSEILPDGWAASYVDGSGTIVARSVRSEEFVGKPASENFRQALAAGRSTWTGVGAARWEEAARPDR
jgi:hypothetical protein